jgi:hypothetical protein
MSDPDHARQMLAIARRDLKALGGMLDADIFAYEIFGFNAQQLAEKAWKLPVSEPSDFRLDIQTCESSIFTQP